MARIVLTPSRFKNAIKLIKHNLNIAKIQDFQIFVLKYFGCASHQNYLNYFIEMWGSIIKQKAIIMQKAM